MCTTDDVKTVLRKSSHTWELCVVHKKCARKVDKYFPDAETRKKRRFCEKCKEWDDSCICTPEEADWVMI
jgi:hypothetical protein